MFLTLAGPALSVGHGWVITTTETMGRNYSSMYSLHRPFSYTGIGFTMSTASLSDYIPQDNEYYCRLLYQTIRRRMGLTALYLWSKHDELQKDKLSKSITRCNKAAWVDILIKLDKTQRKASEIFLGKNACTPHSTLISIFRFTNII